MKKNNNFTMKFLIDNYFKIQKKCKKFHFDEDDPKKHIGAAAQENSSSSTLSFFFNSWHCRKTEPSTVHTTHNTNMGMFFTYPFSFPSLFLI